MSRYLIDCSIAMAWCFQDESSPLADEVPARLPLDGGITPSHWPLEVLNGLVQGERRGRLTIAEVDAFLQSLRVLPIDVHPPATEDRFAEIVQIARAHRLTSYDAAYLELALREPVELATLDAAMHRAAVQLGISTFNP